MLIGATVPIEQSNGQTLGSRKSLISSLELGNPSKQSITLMAGVTQEKDSLLKKMHNEEWILFFEHDPKYQACTINLEGKHYSMHKPVVISE